VPAAVPLWRRERCGRGARAAVVPYLAYARKDRRTKLRDPITTRYIAQIFEAVGVDAVVTADVHNPAVYENSQDRQGEP
jgi:ribose-phosphate pyrophosphokinase